MRRNSVARAAVIAVTLMAAASGARAEWLRAETDHFVVYGDTSHASIRTYARKIERFDALLRTYYPISVDHEIPKLEIFLADGQADMRRAQPGISSSIGGYYSSNNGRIHAVANTQSRMADDVIFHEYGHHFMFQMAASAYPAWFVEGFAEYYGTIVIRDAHYQIGRPSEGRMPSLRLALNAWPPLEDVLRWQARRNGRTGDFYAIAWALTHYMMDDPERTQELRTYLAAVSNGGDPVDSMVQATGKSMGQLRGEVRRYINGPVRYLTPQIPVPDPEVEVTRLDPDHARLIWLDLRLDMEPVKVREFTLARREGESDADFGRRQASTRDRVVQARSDLLREATAAAAINQTSPASLKARARTELLSGDAEAALATLEPLLGADSQDAGALRLAAEILLEQSGEGSDVQELPGRLRRARGYLGRSLDIDPMDFQIYVALDRSRSGASDYPSPNDLSTLQVARELAPQSFDVRLRYARALMALERYPEAILQLGPVAHAPHATGLRNQGRALMVEARRGAGLDVEDEGDPPPEEVADTEEAVAPAA